MQAALAFPRPVLGRVRTVPWLLLPGLVPLSVIVVLVGILFWVSFQRGLIGTADATYTLANYVDVFGDPFVIKSLLNTIVFTVTTVLVAIAIGLPIAWLAERTSIPGKALIYSIMTLGLLIPGIYTAMGWTFIANPRIGFLNAWLRDLFGFENGPIDIATPVGMGFVQGLNLGALAFILVVQLFRAMDPALEEAARIHGLGLARTLWRVTLPLAAPGILAAVIYISAIGFATFDIPAILGLGNRVYLLSTYIYTKAFPLNEAPRYGVIAAMGAFMVLVGLLLTFWYGQVLRQGHRYQVITGKGYRPTLIRLGRWNGLCWAGIFLYAFLSKLLPLALLAFVAFTPYLAPPSLELMSKLSLGNYERMNWGLVLKGLQNTAILVLVVPAAVLVFSFLISWMIVRWRSRARYLLEFGSFLPQALPEIILALGALLLALFVVPGFLPFYGTVWPIAMVYTVARLAFATRAMNGSLLQVHRELEEAAFVAGLSNLRTAWRVIVPLVRPTMMSVWIWTALLVYRELTVAVFLSGPESITLPAVIWSYWFGGARNEASAVTLLMTMVLAPLLVAFWWFGRRSEVTTG